MLYVVDACVPRMRLHRADLHQAEQAGQIIDPEPRAFAAAAFSIVSATSTCGLE
jgi:hypothetical protein